MKNLFDILKGWSYRKKNLAIAGVTLVSLLLIYLVNIQKTFTLWSENSQLEKQLENADQLPGLIQQYHGKLAHFSGNYGIDVKAGELSQIEMLDKLTHFCHSNQLTLREFPPVYYHQEATYEVATNTIMVEGYYTDIVKLIYAIEKQYQLGRVASVEFKTERERRTKRKFLSARIFIQNIKPKSDEA